MGKKTRLVILLICAVLFFIIAPYITLYSIGYRIDFKNRKIMATGGVYIKALPQGVNVIIDYKINKKTGILSNSVFIQNLLPRQHNVAIKKDGYYDYQKNLAVKENEVTKLEHVILFKKNVAFEIITDKSQSLFKQQIPEDKFIIKNNNLYYSNNTSQPPQNTPIIKNIIAYNTSNSNIIWLGLDGFLYSSDLSGKNTEKLSRTKLKINKEGSYQLTTANQKIFLKENNNLLLFDKEKESFKDFYNLIKGVKISPAGQKLLYYNDYEILFSDVNQTNPDKIFLNRFSEKIGECHWLNDDYIIFTLGNKIIISEIYNNDSINTVTLPETISLPNGNNIDIKDAKILFGQQDKKLYILTQGNLLVSEELIP